MNARALPRGIGELLTPRSVAVIGASEDRTKFGGRVLSNLVQHRFAGEIFPINPSRETLLKLKCYPSVASTPSPPDMVIMAVPRATVLEAVTTCATAGAKLAIIITAKFSDAGAEGAALESQVVRVAHDAGMRIMGPNCIGIISLANDLVMCPSPALFSGAFPKGGVGLVSQSGAIMGTLFDRAASRGIGFSHCFSIGNQADLELCDFVDFLIEDPQTRVITSYIEGVKSPRRFMQTARKAFDAGKPWIVVKAGRTPDGAAAAMSHTASLTGSYEAFSAACQACGVLTMDDTDAMMLLAAAVNRHPSVRPRNVAVVTTSGGGGAIAADRLADAEIPLAEMSSVTLTALSAFYPTRALASYPLDVGASNNGGTLPDFARTFELIIADKQSDIMFSPITTAPDVLGLCAGLMEATKAARANGIDKPHILILQPGRVADASRSLLCKEGAIYTDTLDEAIRAVSGWFKLAKLKPRPVVDRPEGLPKGLPLRYSGSIDEATTKEALSGYGVAVNRGMIAVDAIQASVVARSLSPPFVVKVVSEDILHKSDVGGVDLGLGTPDAVSNAVTRMSATLGLRVPHARIKGYLVQEMRSGGVELIVGARNDPQFGPVIMVGAGGILVELLNDVSVVLAPVSASDARKMLESLQVFKLLRGFRNAPPLDVDAVADTVSRISWLVHDLDGNFQELDVNPLLVGEIGAGCVAVDGRMFFAKNAAGLSREAGESNVRIGDRR
jgi:acyl-CoA synthetase (NDP forming)